MKYGDVASPLSPREVLTAYLANFGRIDILVINLGTSGSGGPEKKSEEFWDRHMDVNVNSVYLCWHFVC